MTLRQFSDWLTALEAPPTVDVLRDWLSAVELSDAEIASYVAFDPNQYHRTSVFRSEHVEVLVLAWRSGQRSAIHDHGGSACGVRVLSGEATEITFRATPSGDVLPAGVTTFAAGAIAVSSDDDIHQLGNFQAPGRDLITLHAYAPPLAAARTYRVDPVSTPVMTAPSVAPPLRTPSAVSS